MATSVPATFRAYEFEQFGDALEVVKLNSTVQQQQLQPSMVRLRVHSAGVNPIDYKLVEFGKFFLPTQPSSEHPFRPGFDVAGTVVEVGAEVEGFQVGDAVYGQGYFGTTGSFAEYFDVDAKSVALKPTKLSFTEAGGASTAAQTSFQALTDHAKLQAGERVLILGGSSGTGLLGVQLAKLLGASTVIATTSKRNFELVTSMGADRVIDYTTEKWGDVIEPHSIDIVYDCGVDPQAWNTDAQKVLKKTTGRFISLSDTKEPVEAAFGATLLPWVRNDPSGACLEKITPFFNSEKLVVPIDSVHSFENLKEAIKVQKSSHARGKIVLQVIKDED
ncbi:hypothetical protein BBJ28_00023276 [Nothophytophthora sp. Chile5]|nr:hypothetical protein BBJ28_00023276 [Nothophytophthora sp. Chile5]